MLCACMPASNVFLELEARIQRSLNVPFCLRRLSGCNKTVKWHLDWHTISWNSKGLQFDWAAFALVEFFCQSQCWMPSDSGTAEACPMLWAVGLSRHDSAWYACSWRKQTLAVRKKKHLHLRCWRKCSTFHRAVLLTIRSLDSCYSVTLWHPVTPLIPNIEDKKSAAEVVAEGSWWFWNMFPTWNSH